MDPARGTDAVPKVVSLTWTGGTTMKPAGRAKLEAEFLRICRLRGPGWIESIIRPLGLPGDLITVRDLPHAALAAAVGVFGRQKGTVWAGQQT